jgi:abequosyltransferase
MNREVSRSKAQDGGRGTHRKECHSGDVLQVPSVRLSICITTYNRAQFIGATLESIFSQFDSSLEVVVVDGASTDDTEELISRYIRRYDALRYFKQDTNQGIDRGYDCAVQLARGDYCWFMTDDDLLKPGALAKVLAALHDKPSLLLLNFQRFDISMSELLLSRSLDIDKNIRYSRDEMDCLFSETGPLLLYIGCLVLRRDIWMGRNRQRYFDTMLIHVGVIFQAKLPGDALVIAEPLISYRDGNAKTFWPKMFEICLVKFPATVASFAISDAVTNKLIFGDPGKLSTLLMYRGMGWYSYAEYRKWISPNTSSIRQRIMSALIAMIPGVLANIYCMMRAMKETPGKKVAILHVRMSPFYYRNCRILRFLEGLKKPRSISGGG